MSYELTKQRHRRENCHRKGETIWRAGELRDARVSSIFASAAMSLHHQSPLGADFRDSSVTLAAAEPQPPIQKSLTSILSALIFPFLRLLLKYRRLHGKQEFLNSLNKATQAERTAD